MKHVKSCDFAMNETSKQLTFGKVKTDIKNVKRQADWKVSEFGGSTDYQIGKYLHFFRIRIFRYPIDTTSADTS